MKDGTISPLCAKKIADMNAAKPGQIKFSDFVSLKTYGRDEVSRMRKEDLTGLVTEFELQQIRRSAQSDEDIVKILRWVKRGLNVNHAIRKVQVDKEISLGAMVSCFSK